MRTVWAWQAVQGSRNGDSLHEGQVYNVHSGYGETDKNHGVGPAEKKKCCRFLQNKKYARKNRAMLLCHIELNESDLKPFSEPLLSLEVL